jgi:protein-S-isoprenylcysteine O-methyltransferase Ste14
MVNLWPFATSQDRERRELGPSYIRRTSVTSIDMSSIHVTKALMAVRHLLAVLILPFTVTVIVPRVLLRAGGALEVSPALGVTTTALGVSVWLLGFALFAWCLYLFAVVGRGTLAPWDPTQSMVASGPYRFTRNPMITGVAAMLAGEVLFFRSSRLGWWLLIFVVFNQLYFVAIEEPGLQHRFGAAYEAYRSRVPRWLPRLWRRRDVDSPTDR